MLCNNSLKILGLNLFDKVCTASEMKDAFSGNSTTCSSAKYARQKHQVTGQVAC
jgi:hypothetical protein